MADILIKVHSNPLKNIVRSIYVMSLIEWCTKIINYVIIKLQNKQFKAAFALDQYVDRNEVYANFIHK